MPQLDPTWFASQLFWLSVSFAFLYLALSRLVLPSLSGIIEERKSMVSKDLVMAQEFKAQAEEAKASYERTALEARNMAQNMIDEANANSKDNAAKASKALEAQITTQILNANKAIAVKKQEIFDELSPQISDFSDLIVKKINAR